MTKSKGRSSDSSDIFLYGASGHAKVVIDLIEKIGNIKIRFLIDDNLRLQNHRINGYPISGGRDELLCSSDLQRTFVAIGDNLIRTRVAKWLVDKGYELVTIVHPQACLAGRVKLGFGTVVMAGAVINPDSIIEDNVIINTKASIDHDCILESGVHVAPGATLCGGVSVGRCAFIGAGVTVVPNVQIGENAMVAAGTIVYKNVPANSRIIGARNEW